MTFPSQKVVYCPSFDGFSIPIPVLQEVFRRCPPDTEEGRAIFWARCRQPNESTQHFFGPYVLFSSGMYVGNLNTLEVYSLQSCNLNQLRTNRHFQQVLMEQELTGLEIAEVPFGCTYSIHEEDGKERVVVEVPWKALVEDLLLMCRGGAKLTWNPLTKAMLADDTLAKQILS